MYNVTTRVPQSILLGLLSSVFLWPADAAPDYHSDKAGILFTARRISGSNCDKAFLVKGSPILFQCPPTGKARVFIRGRWTPLVNRTGFPIVDVRGVDDRGEIVGNVLAPEGDEPMAGQPSKPFVISSGGMRLLHDLLKVEASVRAVNRSGYVIANRYDTYVGALTGEFPSDDTAYVVSRGSNSTAVQIGKGDALAVNDLGQVLLETPVVRKSLITSLYVWQDAKRTPMPLSHDWSITAISSFNNEADIAGTYQTGLPDINYPFDNYGAFFIHHGVFHKIHEMCEPTGMNNAGDVVGNWLVTGHAGDEDTHAFVYRHGKLMDLNDVSQVPPKTVLRDALAIDDEGQIIAKGNRGVYLLSPVRRRG